MNVYGIKNCNTVKSALEWLKNHDVSYTFHDYKSKGVTETQLLSWSKQVGWESLVNKRGTTWRQLSESEQKAVISERSAVALMKEKTSVIKRPLVEVDGKVVALGFDESKWSELGFT
ncbi:MAG: ArsC family reductase [Chryseolinea sp.]